MTPRRSSIALANDTADSEFPGQHFQSDLLLLALGSSQKDLFEDDWLDVMVRVYWLKARFLALQVWLIFCFLFMLDSQFYESLVLNSARCDMHDCLSCLLTGWHGVGPGELWCLYRPIAAQTKGPRRETLHHQSAQFTCRFSNLCGGGQFFFYLANPHFQHIIITNFTKSNFFFIQHFY